MKRPKLANKLRVEWDCNLFASPLTPRQAMAKKENCVNCVTATGKKSSRGKLREREERICLERRKRGRTGTILLFRAFLFEIFFPRPRSPFFPSNCPHFTWPATHWVGVKAVSQRGHAAEKKKEGKEALKGDLCLSGREKKILKRGK